MDTTIFLTNCLEQYKQKKKRKFSPRYYDGKFYGVFCTSSSNLYGSKSCVSYSAHKGFPKNPEVMKSWLVMT